MLLARAWENPLENPVVYRTIVSEVTPRKAGFALAAFHIILGAGLVYFLAHAITHPSEHAIAREIGWGRYLNAILQTGIHGLLIIALVFRLSGLIDRVRRDGWFDEVVASGISPLRIAAGAWITGASLAGILLATTLPYAVFCLLLRGLSIGDLLLSYGIQIAYANVVIAVVLAASILGGTRVAVYGGLLLFATFGGLGSALMPGAVAYFGPVRLFLGPIFRSEVYADWGAGRGMSLAPNLYQLELSEWLYAPALWLLLAGVAIAVIRAGPLHPFVPGLNTFGTVTSGRRIRARRRTPRRSPLVRLIEVAFLYRNLPSGLAAGAFRHRLVAVVAVFALVEIAGIGIVYAPAGLIASMARDLVPLALGLIVAPAVLLDLFLAQGSALRARVERIGPLRIRRVLAWDLIFAAGLLLSFVLAAGPVLLDRWIPGWGIALGPARSKTFLNLFGEGFCVLLLLLLILHLVARALSHFTAIASHLAILHVTVAVAVVLVPGLLFQALLESGVIGGPLAWMVKAFPIPALADILAPPSPRGPLVMEGGPFSPFMMVNGILLIVLLYVNVILDILARRRVDPEAVHAA